METLLLVMLEYYVKTMDAMEGSNIASKLQQNHKRTVFQKKKRKENRVLNLKHIWDSSSLCMSQIVERSDFLGDQAQLMTNIFWLGYNFWLKLSVTWSAFQTALAKSIQKQLDWHQRSLAFPDFLVEQKKTVRMFCLLREAKQYPHGTAKFHHTIWFFVAVVCFVYVTWKNKKCFVLF